MSNVTSIIDATKFRSLSKEQRAAIFAKLSDEECVELYYDFSFWARENQRFPEGDWTLWILLSGRGFGKTFVGSSWIIEKAQQAVGPVLAVVGPTAADVRDIILDGPSGILSRCPPWFRPKYSKSIGQLVFPNGVKVLSFSAEDPESLRGVNSSGIWFDELAMYRYPREMYDLSVMANRIGRNPQFVITTTPKPIKILREWIQRSVEEPDKVRITTGNTYDNRDNLSSSFIDQLKIYEGTELGRQEIWGEVLNPEETAIIKRSWFKMWPKDRKLPYFEYIIQSYDTAFTEKTKNNKTASITLGVFREKISNKFCVMLLDSWHDWLKYPDLRKKAMDEFCATFGSDFISEVDELVIEAKGSGLSLFQDLREREIPAFSYNPGKEDKVMRLNSISHLVKSGLVYLIESEKRPGEFRSWAKPFLDEVCSFIAPGPEVEDDYVDAFSQGMSYLRDIGYLSVENLVQDEPDKIMSKKANPYAQ